MTQVIFETGRTLSVLSALRDRKLGLKAANAAGLTHFKEMLSWIHGGNSFQHAYNRSPLERSIRRKTPRDGYQIYTKSPVALFIEHGTAAHIIRPRKRNNKKGLSFWYRGEKRFFTQVNHPGGPALPFFFADQNARNAKALAAAKKVINDAMR